MKFLSGNRETQDHLLNCKNIHGDVRLMGVMPNPKNGSTDRKKGFEILCELADEHNLTQMVDKITHGKETHDLQYPCNQISFS